MNEQQLRTTISIVDSLLVVSSSSEVVPAGDTACLFPRTLVLNRSHALTGTESITALNWENVYPLNKIINTFDASLNEQLHWLYVFPLHGYGGDNTFLLRQRTLRTLFHFMQRSFHSMDTKNFDRHNQSWWQLSIRSKSRVQYSIHPINAKIAAQMRVNTKYVTMYANALHSCISFLKARPAELAEARGFLATLITLSPTRLIPLAIWFMLLGLCVTATDTRGNFINHVLAWR